MVLKITNLHILRYLPAYWLYLLERYAIDNQQCTHTASESKFIFFKNQIIYKTGVTIEKQDFMNQSVLVSGKSFVISQ